MESHNLEQLKQFGLDVGLIISGLFGSLLMLGKSPGNNLGASILSIIGGAASANYLTPVVVDAVSITNPQHGYGIAFMLGFLGLKGIEILSRRFITHEPEVHTQEIEPQQESKSVCDIEQQNIKPKRKYTRKKNTHK